MRRSTSVDDDDDYDIPGVILLRSGRVAPFPTYIALWSFVPSNRGQPLFFSSRPVKGICETVICCYPSN